MNWLITGGCGFLGKALIERLILNSENKIRIVDNLSTGSKNDIAFISKISEKLLYDLNWSDDNQVTLVVGDIIDDKLAYVVSKGADIIVHLASNTGVGHSVKYPRLDMTTNIIGIFNYLEAARQNDIKKFIFASSGATIGDAKPPLIEDMPSNPVSPYGSSKLAGEGYCSSYYNTFGINTSILRFSNVYGPGSLNKNSVIAKFIRQIIRDEPIEIFGDGLQTRDFIFIDDLIDAVLLVSSTNNLGGETFHIASGQETSIIELVHLIKKTFSNFNLNEIKILNLEKRLGDVMRNYSNTTKANKILDWYARTDLKEGIKKTIDYFINVKSQI